MMSDSIPVVTAVDIGGTKMAAAVGSAQGKMLVRFQTETPSEPAHGIEWIANVFHQWLRNRSEFKNRSLCVGCPGPLDSVRGMILKAPNLQSWNEYPLRDALGARLGIPVVLENDANLAAVGEYCFGAGYGYKDLVYITVSTGIGGGLVIDNRLVRGVDDSAGEIGHMTIDPHGPACNCGSRGCLEAMASGTAIMQEAGRRVLAGEASEKMMRIYRDNGVLTAKELAALANQGDAAAIRILEEAMKYLGIGISNLLTTLSPQIVIIGGGVAKIGDLMFKSVKSEVRKRVHLVPIEKIPIVPAKLGGDSALYGGFSMAVELCHHVSEE